MPAISVLLATRCLDQSPAPQWRVEAACRKDHLELSVSKPRVVDLLCDLIAIPSVNPVYEPASPGEGAMAAYVETWARGLGLAVSRQNVFPGRDNILVRLPGPAGAPTLLFEAHMDTVGVDGMPTPFEPALRDDRVYGRGACDTKGSLAAMMAAIEQIVADRAPLGCTVELLAAVDEETSGKGAIAFVERNPPAAAAIVGEPTGCQVINRHNGCVRGEIEVIGRSAHTSVAEEGVNAIDGMADVILALRAVNRELVNRPGGPAANGSLTVSLISGGTGINVVPERCVVSYDRRIVPGQTARNALDEIDAALDDVRGSRPDIGIERHAPWLEGDTLSTPPESAIVAVASAACAALGIHGTPEWVPYGSDASKFQEGGVPAIVFGPGSIEHAHAIDESVPIEDLITAAAFYREVALRFGRTT